MSDPIHIVGAGIAGLTTALSLRQFGFEVEIHEGASGLQELGAGLQLAANATRVLIELGLTDALAPVVSSAQGKEIRLWNTGETWKLFDLGAESIARYGAPYWMVHRGDLFGVLLHAVANAGVPIHTGARCVGYRTQEPHRAVLLFADGREVACRAVIACDGIHSAIRRELASADRPEFSGMRAWRGVAKAVDLPTHLRKAVGVNWVGPGRHVINYPLRGGELVNFVGIVEADDWREEGWMITGDRGDCHRDFEGWHEDVHTLISRVDQVSKWALLKRAPLPQCSDGSVVLIGDACHPTLPFLAQGACMAVEDAYVVARCLAAYETPATAFRAFEKMRLERTARIVQTSNAQGDRFHNPALAHAEGAAAYVSREWAPALVEQRYEWMFRYDAVNVPLPSIA